MKLRTDTLRIAPSPGKNRIANVFQPLVFQGGLSFKDGNDQMCNCRISIEALQFFDMMPGTDFPISLGSETFDAKSPGHF